MARRGAQAGVMKSGKMGGAANKAGRAGVGSTRTALAEPDPIRQEHHL
jgi:hypothetical protein